MTKRTAIQTFRREHDRFWILAAHPEQNLFAAGNSFFFFFLLLLFHFAIRRAVVNYYYYYFNLGHDSGLVVFKLERERPAYTCQGNFCYYIKDKYLRSYEFTTQRDVPVISIRRANGQFSQPRTLSYNPAEHSILVTKVINQKKKKKKK